MSDDTISAEELTRWKAWTEGYHSRPVHPDEIARLIHAYEAAMMRVAELDELKTTLTNATTLLQRICAARDSDVPATDEEWYTLCDDCDLFLTGLTGVLCPNCQTVGDHSTGDGGWSCETPNHTASASMELRRLRERVAELEGGKPDATGYVQIPAGLVSKLTKERDALRQQLAARDDEIAHLRSVIEGLHREAAVAARDGSR